jgi:uncharacterized membrane protein
MDALHVGAVWLHAVAMVIVIGYYGILARVVLPALRKTLDGPGLASTVPAVERRAMPFVLGSVVAFVVTGVYLLVVDDRYGGVGSFDNTWSTMMLVKHLLIVVMVGVAVVVDRLALAVADASDEGRDRALELLGLAAEGATALGAIVLLLTAIAQLS